MQNAQHFAQKTIPVYGSKSDENWNAKCLEDVKPNIYPGSGIAHKNRLPWKKESV